MNLEIKKSIKPINYFDAINQLETRLKDLLAGKEKELIWTLEHSESAAFSRAAQRLAHRPLLLLLLKCSVIMEGKKNDGKQSIWRFR